MVVTLGKIHLEKSCLTFLPKLGKGRPLLFRNTTPSQPLTTEPGDHLLLWMGAESWLEELSRGHSYW